MNRSACAVLSLLIALSLMSFGFTNWPNRNSGSASQTSKFKWGIFSDSVSQGDWGPDLTCEPGLKNARPISEGKDVGATSLNLQDTNKNGAIDTIKIDVKNAYPSYYNKVDIGVKNFGEIAVKVGNAIFIWEGKTFTLESGQVYYLYERIWQGRQQTFRWVNDIDYEYGYRRAKILKIHVVICKESWEEIELVTCRGVTKTTRYAWISSDPIKKTNIHARSNLIARKRWLQENTILKEKHQGYHYEHIILSSVF
jgi:hypothetical protein